MFRSAPLRRSPSRSVEQRRLTMTLLGVFCGARAGAGRRGHLRRDGAPRVAPHAGDRRAADARRESDGVMRQILREGAMQAGSDC